MNASTFMSFLPELVLLLGALVVFFAGLRSPQIGGVRALAHAVAVGAAIASAATLGREGLLFYGAYRVDAFSQFLKLVLNAGLVLVLVLNGRLSDIRESTRYEYFLFLLLSVAGMNFLVSSVDLVTLVVALEVSAYPLYLLVPMRRERPGQRAQMEAAIKYIMFGIAANGIMLFGLSYLFGLTGATSLPVMLQALGPLAHTPAALAGLAMTFCGFYYKLAVFPFQFWTPDVYQGAANETAGVIASLPKVAAVAVLMRFVGLASADHQSVALMLTVLAVASMFYGNLIALVQKDLKRLLGFSGIAHAGYALIGFVALDGPGFTAALFYMIAYLVMVLACFLVVCRVSKDGENVPMEDLAGLHRRSPLLAATLLVGLFGLAGVPPFAGFTGKLTLLTAALDRGHLALVVLAVVNSALAVYYYLGVFREAFFRDAGDRPRIALDASSRALCVTLIVATLALGVAPDRVLGAIMHAVACIGFAP